MKINLTHLCDSVAIIESESDRYHWGNQSEDQPAFLTYIGCHSLSEANALKKTLMQFYRATAITIRPAQRLSFQYEIKAYGLSRNSDSNAFGLDDLVLSQQAKDEERIHEEKEDYLHLAYYDTAWN